MDAISCLAPPPATSFADAAIARALHLPFADSASSSSSSLSAASAPAYYAPPPPTTTHATTTCDSVLVADSPTAGGRLHKHKHKQQLAPAAGRAGKRRSRASKRAPTTYITTDPASFRIMVQHITGVQAEPGDIDILQPTMLMAADASAAAGAHAGNPVQLLPEPDAPAALQQHSQQPCFPTLDSWNVMYERTDLL